jgi:hypothetical protein
LVLLPFGQHPRLTAINKNIIAKLKNKNGGLIQDGDENNFFIFHILSRHFDFLA